MRAHLTRISLGLVLLYLWIMMILFGSITMETFMIYPNIFHNAPERFEIAKQFMSVTGPAQYFRPLGMASVLMGAVAVIAGSWSASGRWWIVASLAMIICEGAVSMTYFWPRNTILFIEGPAVHSLATLRQTAWEFELWHWSRLALNTAGAAFAFVGFLQLYRQRLFDARAR